MHPSVSRSHGAVDVVGIATLHAVKPPTRKTAAEVKDAALEWIAKLRNTDDSSGAVGGVSEDYDVAGDEEPPTGAPQLGPGSERECAAGRDITQALPLTCTIRGHAACYLSTGLYVPRVVALVDAEPAVEAPMINNRGKSIRRAAASHVLYKRLCSSLSQQVLRLASACSCVPLVPSLLGGPICCRRIEYSQRSPRQRSTCRLPRCQSTRFKRASVSPPRSSTST